MILSIRQQVRNIIRYFGRLVGTRIVMFITLTIAMALAVTLRLEFAWRAVLLPVLAITRNKKNYIITKNLPLWGDFFRLAVKLVGVV